MIWEKAKKDKIAFDYGLLFKNGELTDQEQLGITKGGGEFSLKANFRDIPADGLKGKTKGMRMIDGIDAAIKCDIMNASMSVLAMAMPYAKTTVVSDEITEITIDKDCLGIVSDEGYFDNLMLVAKTLEGKYVKIKINEVMNDSEFTFSAKPKEEGVISLELSAHWDDEDEAKELCKITYVDALPVAAA